MDRRCMNLWIFPEYDDILEGVLEEEELDCMLTQENLRARGRMCALRARTCGQTSGPNLALELDDMTPLLSPLAGGGVEKLTSLSKKQRGDCGQFYYHPQTKKLWRSSRVQWMGVLFLNHRSEPWFHHPITNHYNRTKLKNWIFQSIFLLAGIWSPFHSSLGDPY